MAAPNTDSSMPYDYCLVHGRGAKVQHFTGASREVSWWECPQCINANRSEVGPQPKLAKLTSLRPSFLGYPHRSVLNDREVEWVVDTLNILVQRENERNGHVR